MATADITITTNVGPPVALPKIVFQKNFEDAWSVRVGGEHELVPDVLVLRAGYLHETSAVPLASTSVDIPNWERDVVSVGCPCGIGPEVAVMAAGRVREQLVLVGDGVQLRGDSIPHLAANR